MRGQAEPFVVRIPRDGKTFEEALADALDAERHNVEQLWLWVNYGTGEFSELMKEAESGDADAG